MIFEQLTQFRQRLYERLGYAKDALFELMDAVLVSSSIVSFVSLSQSPVFRRQWSSIYAALHDSRVTANQLTPLLTAGVESGKQPLLAGDRTLWSRPDAPTLRERSFGRQEYHRKWSTRLQSMASLLTLSCKSFAIGEKII